MPTKKQLQTQLEELLKARQGKPQRRRLLWSGVLAAATLLGFVAVIPRIDVSASAPIDQSDPFSSSVTVKNNSFYPLRDVEVGISPIDIEMDGRLPIRSDPNHPATLKLGIWGKHNIGIDDKFDIWLGNAVGLTPPYPPKFFGRVDIELVIYYKIWILPWRHEKRVPMYSRIQNGTILWLYREPRN